MTQTLDFGFTEKEIAQIEKESEYLSMSVCEGGSEGWAG